jgi:uncharacterized glyoxalase superfamily protein PhnB/N-acetylglutamate synthase-like GNAT family acetyltransferase
VPVWSITLSAHNRIMNASIRSLTPILPVADVSQTLDFYEHCLRAQDRWIWEDNHGGCSLGPVTLQFSLNPELCQRSRGIEFFIATTDVETLYQNHQEAGVEIIRDLEIKPWGAREYCIKDCNDAQLRFAQFGFTKERKNKFSDFVVVRRLLTADEFTSMMLSVGWGGFMDTKRIEAAISEPLCTVVIEIGGQVVASGSILGHRTGNYLISNVMVRPEFQSGGLGKAVMSELDAWLSENGVPYSLVKLFTGNNLKAFYEQFGFRGPDQGLLGMSKRLPRM